MWSGRLLLGSLAALQLLVAADRKFETASVRPVKDFAQRFPARRVVGGPGTGSPGRIEYQEMSLRDLLVNAYRVQTFQLKMPAWMNETFFTVQAQLPAGANRDDLASMLKAFLAERFNLKMRLEPKDMKGYVLKVGSAGPKFSESPPAGPQAAPPQPLPNRGPGIPLDPEGFMIAPPGATHMLTMPPRDGVQRLTAARASMELFRLYLERQFQQPVVDETALQGQYDFRLAFAPEVAAPGTPLPVDSSDPSAIPQAAPPAPMLVKAVETQLGLKLQSQTVRVDTFVIDHIDRIPTDQ